MNELVWFDGYGDVYEDGGELSGLRRDTALDGGVGCVSESKFWMLVLVGWKRGRDGRMSRGGRWTRLNG